MGREDYRHMFRNFQEGIEHLHENPFVVHIGRTMERQNRIGLNYMFIDQTAGLAKRSTPWLCRDGAAGCRSLRYQRKKFGHRECPRARKFRFALSSVVKR